MKKRANAQFAIKNWDEQPYSEGPDMPKLTRARVTKAFTHDIQGESHVEYLMMYRPDGSATFVGLERVTGRLAGKAGSFVLQRAGVFEGGVAKESYSVVPGSGTGERSEEHTSELQSLAYLVCRLLLGKKKKMCMERRPATLA